MKSCFGYIRVSTQKQGEGVSLEAQKDAIMAFASRNNLNIDEWFEEKETAAKSGRPIFSRMLRMLERGDAAGVIMHKIDRSARNLRDWAIIGELSDKGIGVYFATESLDFRSRGGRLTADIQAVIAADYIRNLREETKKGIDGRLKQGLYPFPAPVGYVNTGKGKAKTPCPINGPIIKKIYDLYASGAHSIRSLHMEAHRLGLRNTSGGHVTRHGIETILRNPFYCGIIAVRRTGQTFKGVHEPLISANTFRYVQEVKAGRAGKKVTRHNHLFRGLFHCSLCSCPLSPERQKGRVYYRCHTSQCPTTTIRQDYIDGEVLSRMRTLTLEKSEAKQLCQSLRDWQNSVGQTDQLASIELRLAQANQRLDRLTDLLIDESITKTDFESRKRSLLMEIATLKEDHLGMTKNQLSEEETQIFLELITSLDLLYEITNDDEKRELVENCFSNRTLNGKNLLLEPSNWLLELKTLGSDPCGAPDRTTSRTFPDAVTVRQILKNFGRACERLESMHNLSAKAEPPEWKQNLKNQSESA